MTGAFHDDQVGHGAEQGQVPGQRGGHRQRQPAARRVSQVRHQGLKQQDGGDVAHHVGEDRREATQDVHAVQLEMGGQGGQILQERGLLDSGNDDEKSGKQNQ